MILSWIFEILERINQGLDTRKKNLYLVSRPGHISMEACFHNIIKKNTIVTFYPTIQTFILAVLSVYRTIQALCP